MIAQSSLPLSIPEETAQLAKRVELADEGFDYSVLSEFRQRLVAGEAQHRVLDKLLSLITPV
jgi:hypothetical protein